MIFIVVRNLVYIYSSKNLAYIYIFPRNQIFLVLFGNWYIWF